MLHITDKMRERMDAGLSFVYTTRSGHVWYIDSTLEFPFRQIDFNECMYDAWDGTNFEHGFPNLSTCQFALEEGCPQWRGEGWYDIGNGDDVRRTEVCDVSQLRELVSVARENFELHGDPWTCDFIGDMEV